MARRTGHKGLFALLAALCMVACSGGGGGGSDSTGQMKLAVGDAPADGAIAVAVKFTGVELIANSGNLIDITFPQPPTSSTRAALLR